MKRRRTEKEIELDCYKGMAKMEHEKATREAEVAFHHKPYQSVSLEEYIANKYGIGGGAGGQGRNQERK